MSYVISVFIAEPPESDFIGTQEYEAIRRYLELYKFKLYMMSGITFKPVDCEKIDGSDLVFMSVDRLQTHHIYSLAYAYARNIPVLGFNLLQSTQLREKYPGFTYIASSEEEIGQVLKNFIDCGSFIKNG
jgi:nucleoside 2-deoxyribosyltransferase